MQSLEPSAECDVVLVDALVESEDVADESAAGEAAADEAAADEGAADEGAASEGVAGEAAASEGVAGEAAADEGAAGEETEEGQRLDYEVNLEEEDMPMEQEPELRSTAIVVNESCIRHVCSTCNAPKPSTRFREAIEFVSFRIVPEVKSVAVAVATGAMIVVVVVAAAAVATIGASGAMIVALRAIQAATGAMIVVVAVAVAAGGRKAVVARETGGVAVLVTVTESLDRGTCLDMESLDRGTCLLDMESPDRETCLDMETIAVGATVVLVKPVRTLRAGGIKKIQERFLERVDIQAYRCRHNEPARRQKWTCLSLAGSGPVCH